MRSHTFFGSTTSLLLAEGVSICEHTLLCKKHVFMLFTIILLHRARFLNLWATEEFLTGHGLVLLNWVRLARQTSKTALLLPWKQNLEAGLMWKKTWSVHNHVLSLEHLCFLTTNRLSLHTGSSTLCSMKCCFGCFYFCPMHVQQLSNWRSCVFGGLWTLFLFIIWVTWLKRLSTSVIED